jgi:S-adenosylmethionine:tRNA ribosyltransferase-isomerase
LLRAFADDDTLERAARELEAHSYRTHEFGDSVLIERMATVSENTRLWKTAKPLSLTHSFA